MGTPAASFTGIQTAEHPVSRQFTDTSTGDITDYSWDFGPPSPHRAQSPGSLRRGRVCRSSQVAGPAAGRLRRRHDRGRGPQAGFECLPTRGFAPLGVCARRVNGAAASNGASGRSTSMNATRPSSWRRANSRRADGAECGRRIDRLGGDRSVPAVDRDEPRTGAARSRLLTARGGVSSIPIRIIDGRLIGLDGCPHLSAARDLSHRPAFGDFARRAGDRIDASGYGLRWRNSAGAGRGPGPLSVAFEDGRRARHALGLISRRQQALSAPAVPAAADLQRHGPTHVYAESELRRGLVATGPGLAGRGSVRSTRRRRRGARPDPRSSFRRSPNQIAGAWTHLRPADQLVAASHRALSAMRATARRACPATAPEWAVLGSPRTDGATTAVNRERHRAEFRPVSNTVLGFDYARSSPSRRPRA
jgi:hypothetical protein